jgi:hypothetical protein
VEARRRVQQSGHQMAALPVNQWTPNSSDGKAPQVSCVMPVCDAMCDACVPL